MPVLNDSFLEFVARLSSSRNEPLQIKAHRTNVYKALCERVELTHFFEGGSWNYGTNVPHYDSVDYFAVIDMPPPNSHMLLENVASELKYSFPNVEVYVSPPRISLAFGRDSVETLNVIPAKYLEISPRGYGVYGIADPYGKWLKVSPYAHKDLVKSLDEAHQGRARGLIRLIRAWKYYQFVPISSFYLEMQTVKYIQSVPDIVYALDIRTILHRLWDTELPPLHDLEGLSTVIYPYHNEATKHDALTKLEQALSFLGQAHEAEMVDDVAEASHWWNMVYQGHFPIHSPVAS
jgi:hypothetical protein